MTQVKGAIFDIDGTLILNNQPLPGATDAVNGLRSMGVQLRFVTNTTGRTPEQLGKVLRELGFEIQDSEILTSVGACVHFLKQNYVGKAGYLAIPAEIEDQFAEIARTTETPAFVVMGDLDEGFDYDVLNRVFNYMRNGAQLITFHRNRFFFKDGKTWLDSGAFTLALEQSCDQKAIVTGKPGPVMFQNALSSMKLKNKEVLVIGDDVSTDIVSARKAGMSFFLVRTGKFKQEDLEGYEIDPKYVISDLRELTNKSL